MLTVIFRIQMGGFTVKLLKSLLFWVLTVEIVIVVALGCLGFKITYDPNIVSDWNAVSATANWVSALATICIPIIAVMFQHRLDKNKNEISEANKATLAELKKFKDQYADILEALSSGEEIVLDCGGAFGSLTEQNLLDYIRATINITAYDAAVYFGTEKSRTVAMLDSLVEQKLVVRTDSDGIGIYSLYR